jgi:ATP-dependent RNA helicase DHX8/PRP22
MDSTGGITMEEDIPIPDEELGLPDGRPVAPLQGHDRVDIAQEERDFDVLPVEGFRSEIVAAIRANTFLICVGETGSGKTTKIPQYCLDYGLATDGHAVAITQPRRVAAITVANRVASERKGLIGDEVGYSVRFDDKTSRRTRIKYVTDGILVRELLFDPVLSAYSVIVLDEAHERSIHTDILFALAKAAVQRRNGGLRVVITSATLDIAKFQRYFNNCAVIIVPGRVFPVDIFHSKNRQIMTAQGPASNGYIQNAVDVALQLHFTPADEIPIEANEKQLGSQISSSKTHATAGAGASVGAVAAEVYTGPGHILIFLTGAEEVEEACRRLRKAVAEAEAEHAASENSRPYLLVLPLYASLPLEQQHKVFAKADLHQGGSSSSGSSPRRQRPVRKCVIATNIAETSVTVPHIRYVIDCGYVKQQTFDPTHRLQSLTVVPVSQVSAQQRAGRAGRTCT